MRMQHGCHHIELSPLRQKTWLDAAKDCCSRGMSLAIIETSEEAACLSKHFESSNKHTYQIPPWLSLGRRVLQLYSLVVGSFRRQRRGQVPVVPAEQDCSVRSATADCMEKGRAK